MRGRPAPSEAAPYYAGYIDQVHGDDVLSTLEKQVEETAVFLSGIGDEKSLHRYEPGKWSIREALSHVNDTRGFDSSLPSYDQNVAAAGAKADNIAWAEHIEEFRRVRLATLSLFAHLPEEAWLRTGIASDNVFSVRALAWIIAGHLAHHVTIIRDRYLQLAVERN